MRKRAAVSVNLLVPDPVNTQRCEMAQADTFVIRAALDGAEPAREHLRIRLLRSSAG